MNSFENGEFPKIGEVVRLFREQVPISFFGINNLAVFDGKTHASVVRFKSNDTVGETTTTSITDLFWEPAYAESK